MIYAIYIKDQEQHCDETYEHAKHKTVVVYLLFLHFLSTQCCCIVPIEMVYIVFAWCFIISKLSLSCQLMINFRSERTTEMILYLYIHDFKSQFYLYFVINMNE